MTDRIPLKLKTGPNEIAEFETSDTVPVAHLPAATVYTSTTQTLSNKELDNTTKVSGLNSTGGVRAVDVSSTGGSGTTSDRITVTAQAAGSGAVIQATSSAAACSLLIKSKGAGTVKVYQNTTDLGDVVGTTGTQTLSGKTLTTPVIGDFSSATHTHTSSATGGTLSASAIANGTLGEDRIADAGNRSGSYLYGRGNATLIDDTSATGGTGRWAQRARVGQVQAVNYSVTGVPTATLSVFSSFACPLTETSGFSFNTTPDCVVDTTGGPTPTLSTSTRKGKVIRVTLNGQVTTVGAKDLVIQLRVNANTANITCQIGGVVSLAPFVAVGYITYHEAQNPGASGNVHWWWESARVFRAGASYEGIGATTGGYTPISFNNGTTATFDTRMQIVGGIAGDTINCYNTIWEVLN